MGTHLSFGIQEILVVGLEIDHEALSSGLLFDPMSHAYAPRWIISMINMSGMAPT